MRGCRTYLTVLLIIRRFCRNWEYFYRSTELELIMFRFMLLKIILVIFAHFLGPNVFPNFHYLAQHIDNSSLVNSLRSIVRDWLWTMMKDAKSWIPQTKRWMIYHKNWWIYIDKRHIRNKAMLSRSIPVTSAFHRR